MHEGQLLAGQRLGRQVDKAFGRGSHFGGRGPSLERPKPGGQTRDAFSPRQRL